MHNFFLHIQKRQILQNHSQIELFAFPFCFSTRKEKGLWEKVLPWKRPHLPPTFLQTSIFWLKISISKRWLEAAQLISPETVYWVKMGGIPTERENDCRFGDRPFLFLTNARHNCGCVRNGILTYCAVYFMQQKTLVCSSMLCCCRMTPLRLKQVVYSYREIALL